MEQIILEQIFAEMLMPHFATNQFDANIDGIFADMDLGDSQQDFYNDPDLFDAFFNAMLIDEDYEDFFEMEQMGLNLLDEIAEVLEEYEEDDDLPEEAPARILLAETENVAEEPII